MTTYDQSGKRDAGKTRFELLVWPFVEGIANVLTFGAQKYADDSWRQVADARKRYFAAAVRHVLAWWRGENTDPESGMPHLHHAACNLMFLDALDASEAPATETELEARVIARAAHLGTQPLDSPVLDAIARSAKRDGLDFEQECTAYHPYTDDL